MTTPNRSGQPQFQVVSVSDGQYSQDAAGNTVEGHKVYFRLASGATSSIFVPNTQFNAETVAELVKAAAANLAAVASISGNLD